MKKKLKDNVWLLALFLIIVFVAFGLYWLVSDFKSVNRQILKLRELREANRIQKLRLIELNTEISKTTDKIAKLETLEERRIQFVDSIQSEVKRLTTEEVNKRITNLELRSKDLRKEMDGLQQLITPKTIDDILSVGKMKEEIMAREKFETKVEAHVKEIGRKIEELGKRLEALYYWIWGTLLTIIGGLIAAIIFLGKRLSTVMVDVNSQPKHKNG